MVNRYCDHGAYSSSLGAVPTWGVPQEGDGSVMPVASSASIASLTINAVAVAGNTINICGVLFTAIASGAGLTQFNVGASTSVQATNIANAFNLSQVVVAVGVAPGQPQLRNLIYARAVGSIVQVMMRVGSTSLNYANNVNVGIVTGGWGTAPTIVSFSGGTGGCWGTYINGSAMGVSNSIAAMTYGLWLYKPYLNTLSASDIIICRTGTNPVITYSLASAMNLTATHSAQIVFDTNTSWIGDGNTGVFTLNLNITTGGSSNIYPNSAAALTAMWFCNRRGNFKINYTNSSGGSLQIGGIGVGISGVLVLDGVSIIDNSPSGSGVIFSTFGGSGQIGCAIWRNIDYTRSVPVLAQPGIISLFPYQSRGSVSWEGCTFNYALTGAGDPGAILTTGSYAPASDFSVSLTNCTFNGYSGGLKLYAASIYQPNDTSTIEIVVSGCGGIEMPSGYLGLASNNIAYLHSGRRTLNYADSFGGFRYESARSVSEFIPGTGFPTLNSYMFDESTIWSQRNIWLNGVITPFSPGVTSPVGIVMRSETGVKTLTLELYVSGAIGTPTTLSGYVAFNYTDGTNIVRTENITMNSMVGSGVSWDVGVTVGYVPKKINLTTAYPVKKNTEIFATLVFTGSPPSGQTEYIYMNPTIGIA